MITDKPIAGGGGRQGRYLRKETGRGASLGLRYELREDMFSASRDAPLEYLEKKNV